MAQTNTAEQMEMAFMEDGGLQDDGANVDAVSGNEVPSGSMDQEVRDDVPAMLSEGEYVVPADVVRFHGVKLFEDLRMEAKMGMGRMESEGRIGGEPIEEDMDDELPFDISELQTVEEPVREMAEGGEVGPTFTYNPNTRYMERQRATSGFDMRVYINPATGRQITIPFFNGQPMSAIPEGFVLASDQAAAQQTTAQSEPYTERPSQGFIPSAPSQFGFDAFTTEDWANYVKQADGQLAAFTANIPILGTLQRLSESSAKAYAEKALETGKHPATNKALTPEEISALQSVLNSSITERKSILESIGDLFKGEPDQNMSPRPDYAKPSLDPYNEEAARLAQEQQGTGAFLANKQRQLDAERQAGTRVDPEGQKFASRTDVMTDAADPMAAGVLNITDPLVSVLLDEASVTSLDDIKNSGSIASREAFDGDSALRTNAEGETIFKAYKDSVGYWTVGPGILLGTIDKKGKQTVSEEAIQKDYTEEFVKDEFVKSLNEATNYIDNKYNADLMPPLARATLINMRFQLGNRFETFTQLDKAIKEGNFTEAAKQVLGNYKVGDKFAFSTDAGVESKGPTLYATQTTNRARRHATRFDLVASQYGKLTPATSPRFIPEAGAATPYTTDAAGFAGDIPPPVASPVASPVTPSFVEGMDAVPQAGAVQPQQSVAPVSGGSIPTMENIMSMLSGANIDTSIAPNVRDLIRRQREVPPIATEGGFAPEVNIQAPSIQTVPQLGQTSKPIQTAPQFDGQPPQNLSNRAMARKDVTRAQGVPLIATEGGFPPLGTTQAGPTVATTQGLQPPQATTFDAPIIEPSASDLLKYEPKGDPLPSSKVGGAGRFPNIAKPTISDSQLTLGSPITAAQMPQALNTQTEQVFDPREATFTDAIKGAYKAAPSEEEVIQTNLDDQKDKTISEPKNFKPKIVFGASSLARGNSDAARKNQHRSFDGSGIALTQYGSVQFHPTERAGGGPSKPNSLDLFRFRVDGERQKFIRRYELEKILGKNFTTADIMAFDPTKWKRVNTGEKNLFGVDVGELVPLDAPPKGLAGKKSIKKQENINKQIKKAQEAYDATADYKKKAAIDTSYGGLGKKKAKELGITGYGGGRATGGIVKRRATKKKNT